jgi:hypothetical protein
MYDAVPQAFETGRDAVHVSLRVSGALREYDIFVTNVIKTNFPVCCMRLDNLLSFVTWGLCLLSN